MRRTSTAPDLDVETGEDLRYRLGHRHRIEDDCPACGRSIMTTALVNLVYTFEVCVCGDTTIKGRTFRHLVEAVWHRRCFVIEEATSVPE